MADKTFEWTDELISELISGAGFTFRLDSTSEIIRKFKEEKSKPKRDWRVMEYRVPFLGEEGVRFLRCGDDKYSAVLSGGLRFDFKEKHLIEAKAKIYSVQRLSDNETFSIGDRIQDGVIDGFVVGGSPNDGNRRDYDLWVSVEMRRGLGILLSHAKKSKSVILTTEDGVEITDEEAVIYYVAGWSIREKKVKNCTYIDNKKFAQRESAEKYVFLNKPSISIEEAIWLCHNTLSKSEFEGRLKKLVENKKL